MRSLGGGDPQIVVSERLHEMAQQVMKISKAAFDARESLERVYRARVALRLLPERERASIVAVSLPGLRELLEEIRSQLRVSAAALGELERGFQVRGRLAMCVSRGSGVPRYAKKRNRFGVELAGIGANEVVRELARVAETFAIRRSFPCARLHVREAPGHVPAQDRREPSPAGADA